MEKKTIVAARYVRNSDPSKKDSEVQQAQADALAAYAHDQGWECPDNLLYRDAISALKHPYWERADLMRLWDDAERGLFNVALCTEFFRVARTTAEQYAVIEYLKRFKVELISITERFEDTQEGHLMFMLQGWLGSVEAEKIRLRTARGKQHRASRALTGQGSQPMYGYLWVDGLEYTRERYVLNLEVIHVDTNGYQWTEPKVIEFCYDSCLRGMSLIKIAQTLTRLGVPTRMQKDFWDASTVRRFLMNICYTGQGINGRYAKEQTQLKTLGIYPKIVTMEQFEAVQQQLKVNSEMSPRNNKHPHVGLLRGLAFCGVCGHKLFVKNYAPSAGYAQRFPDYMCIRHEGVDDYVYHHSLSIKIHQLDKAAWEFALPYIKEKGKIRDYIASLKQQVNKRDHSADLEQSLTKLRKSIAALIKLAETCDPEDEEGTQALQDRLATLQREKIEKEKLYNSVDTNEKRQEKLIAALDRFEAWTDTIRPYLEDPNYEIAFEDMREAMLVMGVKVTVFPINEKHPDRVQMTLFPPDIARFCDYDFTKSISWDASLTIK
ncbi:MAG: recombinase family protein [Ktedonobacteraceae bacterium]